MLINHVTSLLIWRLSEFPQRASRMTEHVKHCMRSVLLCSRWLWEPVKVKCALFCPGLGFPCEQAAVRQRNSPLQTASGEVRLSQHTRRLWAVTHLIPAQHCWVTWCVCVPGTTVIFTVPHQDAIRRWTPCSLSYLGWDSNTQITLVIHLISDDEER